MPRDDGTGRKTAYAVDWDCVVPKIVCGVYARV